MADECVIKYETNIQSMACTVMYDCQDESKGIEVLRDANFAISRLSCIVV